MYKLFSILAFIFISSEIFPQQPWVQIDSTANTNYNDIRFTDSLTGYCCYDYSNGFIGFGGLNKSTNGGINWQSVFNGIPVKSVFFINSSTGWIAGGYWDDGGRKSREIFKTTNGGINFTRQFLDSLSGVFKDMQFVDLNNGFCVTDKGRLFHTSNSGANWIISDSVCSYFSGLSFVNSNTGFALSGLGNIYKTTNKGLNWTTIPLTNDITDICFINENTGWICGYNYSLYKTTNGGNTILTVPFNHFLITGIQFIDANKGWACGSSGKILFTSNGGFNWINQISGTSNNLKSIFMLNDKFGWVLGGLFVNPFLTVASIHKTSTGGFTFIKSESNEIPARFSLSQNYPNPFNPVTKIRFDIPKSSLSKIVIYDITGNEISTLLNNRLAAGIYETEFNAADLPSGVYFYKLTTEDFSETKKMVLIK